VEKRKSSRYGSVSGSDVWIIHTRIDTNNHHWKDLINCAYFAALQVARYSYFYRRVLFFSTIDYRCENDRVLASASCVTFSNPYSLSRSQTGVNPGIRSWRNNYLIELDVWKPLVVSISQRSEELRLYTWFRIWHFQTPGSKAVSSNASPGWTVWFFGNDDKGFMKERVHHNSLATKLPLNSLTLFCLYIYSSCPMWVLYILD
jgi:hypothetical protein